MAGGNCTQVSEFMLTGFSDSPEIQAPLFVVFLLIYVTALVGNLGMILIVRLDSQLRTPMYFFLSNLSFIDLCYSTVVAPKMLADLLAERKAISYTACAIQICVFSQFDVMECFLLAAMAYDRYVAICHPLLYRVVMCPRLCVQLVAGSFLVGCVNVIAQTTGMLTLTFCGSNVIDLFFCDISPLLSLASSDSRVNHILLLVLASLTGVFTGLVVLISYMFILSAILRIRSAKGRLKAFSTCASHLTVVSLFYGTGLFIYLQPSTTHSRSQDKVVSVFYTVVTPMLNPLIYSLRNKEVKAALKRVMERKKFLLSIN
nr:olfactory receptor 1002-like [Pelodiscus sinensis]|eukprot:XP_006117012.1 olfactory receptor 1002-like [Pelodiscus sinensis]